MLPVSQVRIWVESEATALRSVRSEEVERTQARMVLDLSRASWRMNSRPRPRLAPWGVLSDQAFVNAWTGEFTCDYVGRHDALDCTRGE